MGVVVAVAKQPSILAAVTENTPGIPVVIVFPFMVLLH